jgi:cytochrome P450
VITGPEVILPQSQIKWLLEQPDSILNQHEVNTEFLHAERTMLHPNIVRTMVHGRVIRREMTKDLDRYANFVVEEIEDALEFNWGADTTVWKEVGLYDSLLNVIARISNRVLVGVPLCRDPEFLKSSSTYARSVVITAGVLNLLPYFLRPVCGPLVMAYDKYHYRKIARHVIPIIEARALQLAPGLEYREPDYSKHDDYLQWALHDAYSHDDELERSPEMISKRLVVLSFAAIQSSAITATNCIFDIAATPKSTTIQAALREEVSKLMHEFPDSWCNRKHLSTMVRVDSTLRESMRLWGFISRGIMKKVVATDGVTLPSGQHLPQGSKVGITSYAIHHDESIYQSAMKFEPFRFCSDMHGKTSLKNAVSMVTSADDFMAFSHGRHAW